jgi:cytochrome b561
MTLVGLLSVPIAAHARPYRVDYAQSHVRVSGEHAGNPFIAAFERWEAEIDFDPEQLAASKITARFYPEALKSGNKMYDGTLVAADWFNVKAFPEALFESTGITYKEGYRYHVVGALTLRDITQQISFDFMLSDLARTPVEGTAAFDIQRLDFDIGKASDPEAEWVSKAMAIDLKIIATPQE